MYDLQTVWPSSEGCQRNKSSPGKSYSRNAGLWGCSVMGVAVLPKEDELGMRKYDRSATQLALFCRTPYPGGAPANLACALQKLGTNAAFISALGQDELAVKMMDLLKGMPGYVQ